MSRVAAWEAQVVQGRALHVFVPSGTEQEMGRVEAELKHLLRRMGVHGFVLPVNTGQHAPGEVIVGGKGR
jgi:type IV pilus biogenesis protein CpaD/CtpE